MALLILLAILGGPSPPALAWGRLGHRASAKLAESRLTPEARAIIRDLLDPGESLADASTWADENNRSIPGSAAWHFVNVPISAPRYSPRDCHNNCVVSKIEEFRRVLADPRAPKARRRMALRFVVHLVQDAHQPMHVGDRHDRGGNALQLQFFRDDATNLHQIWDSGLLRERYRDEADLVHDLAALARQPEARGWLEADVEDWIDESLEAARQAYRSPRSHSLLRSGMRIGRDYEEANLPLAVKRLAQAGVRLAEILNELSN
jgi:nuclease S1